MKRIIFLFFAAVICTFSVMAAEYAVKAEEKSHVEVYFDEYDNKIIVNGTEYYSETAPYTVKYKWVDYTFVPVRVFAEAFGYEVGWENETCSVTLTKGESKVTFQIGSNIIYIDGKALKMEPAPELPTSTTMVPLDFILQYMGAESAYVSNKGYTLVKPTDKNNIPNACIGDSFYGWYMENPDYLVCDKLFGSYAIFGDYGDSYLKIAVTPTSQAYGDIETYYDMRMNNTYEPLLKIEKNTERPDVKTLYWQAANDSVWEECRMFFTTDYVYSIEAYVSADNSAVQKTFSDLLASFNVGFDSSDTYDIYAELFNGYGYKNESFGCELIIPEGFGKTPAVEEEKLIRFNHEKADGSYISVEALDKTVYISTEKLINEQRQKCLEKEGKAAPNGITYVSETDEIYFGNSIGHGIGIEYSDGSPEIQLAVESEKSVYLLKFHMKDCDPYDLFDIALAFLEYMILA